MAEHLKLIKEYFPKLTAHQLKQFEALGPLYKDWNEKINIISRKDIDQLYLHHILHSLAIAKYAYFKKGTSVLDLGTGGGFPGIPLAIMFPSVRFHLIDGTAKKIKITQDIIEQLELDNVSSEQKRAEEHKLKYDFVVNRAVAQIDKLWSWARPLIHSNHKNGIPNGLLSLKGGNLKTELSTVNKRTFIDQVAIADYFKEEYFVEKYIIYVQR